MKKHVLKLTARALAAATIFGTTTRLQKRVLIALIPFTFLIAAATMPSHGPSSLSPDFFVSLTDNPAHLLEEDMQAYKTAFGAMEAGDYQLMTDTIATLRNPRLVGYLQAQQYLSQNYQASNAQLTSWLAAYSDHPQAAQISRLAIARGLKVAAIEPEAPLKGNGYAEHLGRSTMPDSWYRGLSLWREKNYSDAAPLFTQIGENKNLSGWQRAAGYYWAYRASDKLNDRSGAKSSLKLAANFETTFYGLLAIQQMNGQGLEGTAPRVSSTLRNSPQAIRAVLFAQLGRTDEAESELRHLYSAVDAGERTGIITLAHELNLANLQVRLAGLSQLTPQEEIFASYPMPQYVIDAQAEQSPALLLAIARNESGFREVASSSAGAVGLMQMLPSTAHAVERRVGRDALQVASQGDTLGPIVERLSDPATSVRYSAQYLKILSQEAAVGNNLVRVLAAYNAGPGNVSSWSAMARNIDDPLLYIESIPYPETRNYVMQVLAHSWVYGSLLGDSQESLRAIAKGQWPAFAG